MDSTPETPEMQQSKPWRVWIDSPVIDSASQVGARGLAVYMVLVRYANKEHLSCHPAEKTIGDALGMTARSVRDVLGTLETAEWIRVSRTKGTVNVYSFPPINTGRKLPHPPKMTGRNPQELGKKTSAPEEEFFRTTPEENFPLTEPSKQNPLTEPINRTQGRKAAGVVEIPIPVVLDTEEFRAAWEEWKQHRKEIKKKLTPTSIKKQFTELESMGVARAVVAINLSIKNGWTGIFEPNGDSRNGNGKSYKPGPGQVYDPSAPTVEW